jgi:heme/copper-type cytochrome/quinol oxidase subunit 3
MEASASAPLAPHIEPEPPAWQPRALWATARLLCGAASFFFMAFVFAYFYLWSLDVNKSWKIGSVDAPIGWGIAITVVLVASAVLLRVAARRPFGERRLAAGALVLALLAVVLQVIEWTTLGFGPDSGAYASVFIGWTSLYAVFALVCAYWIETQVASVWRAHREGINRPRREGVPADDVELLVAGLEACSFFWAFYVASGVLAFVILYVV